MVNVIGNMLLRFTMKLLFSRARMRMTRSFSLPSDKSKGVEMTLKMVSANCCASKEVIVCSHEICGTSIGVVVETWWKSPL